MKTTGFLAPQDLVEPLRRELKGKVTSFDRLLLSDTKPESVHWAQNIWYSPTKISFSSISDAAKKLKDIQRNWALYPFTLHRRASLISEKLPVIKYKPLVFPQAPPQSALGSWTLIDEGTLLCSANCSSAFPNGEPRFAELKHDPHKLTPPSRAYLKLWEAFTITGSYPKKDQLCLDLGACPGGWSFVLASLGAEVISVDRTALDPMLMKHPRVNFIKGDAFKFLPEAGNQFDWIFSDLACFPEKLFELVDKWLSICPKANFVCTLKFQGQGHYSIIPKFTSVKGSKLLHLHNNKHELTWIRLNPEGAITVSDLT